MLNFRITAKDMDILAKDLSNIKTQKKNKAKDFFQVLENQRFSQGKPKVTNTDKEKSIEEIKVSEKKIEEQLSSEKPIEKEDKTKKEIEDKLIVFLNLIYSFVEKLDVESEELENMDLEPIKLEIEKLSIELEGLLDDNNLSFNQENIANIIKDFEDLIPSFEEKLDKFTTDYKDENVELPIIDEVSDKLEEIKDTIKSIEYSNIQLKEEDYANLEDEGKALIIDGNKENVEIEFENFIDKGETISKEDEQNIENAVVEEEIQTEDVENVNPLFEVIDRSKIHEKPEIKNNSPEEVNKKEVIQQIVDKAKLIVDDNKQEIKIKLKPEILGELMLKMEVQKESVLAKIIVDNYKTKELIEANLYQLKQDMKENGLEIKTFEVFVGNNEDFERENRQEFNFKQKRGKLKIKNKKLQGIESYNESTTENIGTLYEEGGLNLFA